MTQLSKPFDAAEAVAKTKARKPAYIVDDNPRSSFIDEMRSYGFEVPALPVIGKIERVKGPNDKAGKKNGWYIYNEIADDYQPGALIGIGVFGDWRGNPERVVWASKRRDAMSVAEGARFDEQLKAEKIARDEDLRQRREAAAEKANQIWSEATEAPDEHPYLTKKGIHPHGAKVSRGKILVPVKEGDRIVSLQFIDVSGAKKFLSGGKIKGCYYKIEGRYDTVYVCEGFATGATLHDATEATVYVAYNAGNLQEVTSAAKDDNPDSEIVIAGDDDHQTDGNPGRAKANAAGDVMRCKVIFPEVDNGDTDFNDMAQAQGIEAVKELLESKPTVFQKRVKYDAMPEALLDPPGVLGDIAAYYNATARAPQPGFAVQTALALGSVVCARNFQTSEENLTSLYFLNVAKSGTGKEHAKKVIEKCLEAAGFEELINGSGYTSAGGLFSMLLHRPRHVTVIDEFGRHLEAAQNGKNSNLFEANTQMMECIGRLDGTLRPPSYSSMGLTKDKAEELINRKVHNPAITMLAMTTPVTLYRNLNSTSVADGFIGRLLIHQSNQPRMVHELKGIIEVPHRITDWIEKVNRRAGYDAGTVSSSERPDIITIPFSGPATRVLKEFDKLRVSMCNELEPYGLEELPSRIREFSMRIALICALAKDPDATVIEDIETNWAMEYVKFCVNQTISVLKMRVSGSEFEGNKKSILLAIREAGEHGVSWTEMQKRPPFSTHKPKDMKEILSALVDAELASKETIHTGKAGRPRVAYVALD